MPTKYQSQNRFNNNNYENNFILTKKVHISPNL